MKTKTEAIIFSEQINLFLYNNILSEKLFDNSPYEIVWDRSILEWNDNNVNKCRRELLDNQDNFISDYHKIDNHNYGIIILYNDFAKIDKLVEDIYENIKDIQTGISDSHIIDFFFFDNSSINIELIEEDNKISKIGLIGWFVDGNDKSYTDAFREEFKNKLQNRLK